MLLQLRDYIKKQKLVSIAQMTREFNIDTQALKPMMEILIKKGIVRKEQKIASCTDLCSSCKMGDAIYYSWSI